MTLHLWQKSLDIRQIPSSAQAKTNGPGSRCSSTSSLNSLASDALTPSLQNGRNHQINEWNENNVLITPSSQHALHPASGVVSTLTAKSPLREQQQQVGSNISVNGTTVQKALISGKLEHFV